MNSLCCPYFDRLGRRLIEAYRRVEDRDVFCFLDGQEVRNEIEVIHLAMTEHRGGCPLCLRIDHARLVNEKATSNGLKERAQPVH